MSTIDSEDRDVTGYFLPEDTQLRLKQLREYVGFLTNLARPRRPAEDSECYNEIRPGEVAICFELIEEQIGLVLDDHDRTGVVVPREDDHARRDRQHLRASRDAAARWGCIAFGVWIATAGCGSRGAVTAVGTSSGRCCRLWTATPAPHATRVRTAARTMRAEGRRRRREAPR